MSFSNAETSVPLVCAVAKADNLAEPLEAEDMMMPVPFTEANEPIAVATCASVVQEWKSSAVSVVAVVPTVMTIDPAVTLARAERSIP